LELVSTGCRGGLGDLECPLPQILSGSLRSTAGVFKIREHGNEVCCVSVGRPYAHGATLPGCRSGQRWAASAVWLPVVPYVNSGVAGISLICVAGDGAGEAPTTTGAPVIAANNTHAIALLNRKQNLIAKVIPPNNRRSSARLSRGSQGSSSQRGRCRGPRAEARHHHSNVKRSFSFTYL